ncbi:MAG: hypothetical protein AB7F65_04655 [Dehalococcoidia bacterium]
MRWVKRGGIGLGGMVAVLAAMMVVFSGGPSTADPSPGAGGAPASGATAEGGDDAPALALRDVRFIVDAPEDTDRVWMRVLGVSDYEFLRSVELIRSADGLWTADVPLEEGALVRYRYDRATEDGIAALEEFREAPHEQLRTVFRLLHVAPELTEVRDTVAMWNDDRVGVPSAEVRGRVVDEASGEPLGDLEVEVAGMHGATAYDGSFRLVEVPVGEQRITVHAADGRYLPASVAITVGEGGAEAEVRVRQARPVSVTFVATLPEDTPPWAEVKLEGNAEQVGGWHYLAPGLPDSLVSPTLERDGDTARITLTLYEGQYVTYRYNLGLAGVNTERAGGGQGVARQFVASEGAARSDRVEAWALPGLEPTVLRVTVPANTPRGIPVQLHMGPSHWMTPVDGEWRAILYGFPGDIVRIRYILGAGGEHGFDASPDTEDGYRDVVLGDAAEVFHEVTTWDGFVGSHALAAGEEGRILVRLTVSPEDEGRDLVLAGDPPFRGAVLAPLPGNPSVYVATVSAAAGEYALAVAGCETSRASEPRAPHALAVRFAEATVDLWSSGCDGVPDSPARDATYISGTYTPDLFSPDYLRTTDETYAAAAAAGSTLVAISGVQSYGRIDPLPTLETRPIFAGAVRTPRSAALFQAAAASKQGLGVLVAPQFNMEMTTGRETLSDAHGAEWWAAWLRLAEEHWLYHAELAAEVDAELLLLPGPVFHVYFPPDWLDAELRGILEDGVADLTTQVRAVYDGQLLMSGSQRDYAFLEGADLLGVTTYDLGHPQLGAGASLDEWVAAYEQLFRERVDPIHERWAKPVFFYTIHVPSEAADGDPGGQYRQALQLEAIYRAIEARPWISGSMSWAWFMQPAPDAPNDGFRGRLAEAVQAKWFERFAAAAP